MSYESKLDHQSSKLINPAQLCLLLSIILHLLILRFGLPSIAFNNDSGRREVSVIELDSEQQARLPNLYPQLPAPDQPNLANLPQPDANAPASPFAIPPGLIPGITDPSQLPPLTIPPPPQFNLPPLPPVTDITLPPVGDLSQLPAPPAINPQDFQVEPVELPPNLGKVPNPPDIAPPDAPQQPQPPVSQAPAQPVSPQPKKQPQPTQEQATPKVAQSQQKLRNLTQSLTRNEAGTTDEEARKNYIAWLGKVQNIEPDNIEIVGSYPRDACIRRLQGDSVFGTVIDAQGQVVALDLIKGAEYPIFNQQGSKDINSQKFTNATGQPKPLQVTVKYEYDSEICPSLTLPSIRRQEEKQQPPKTQEQAPAPENPSPPATKPPAAKPPETKPATENQPAPAKPKPEVKPETKPEVNPPAEPTPPVQPAPLPSLREQLRDVPLPELNPEKLKDINLPDKPNFDSAN